MGRWEEKGEGEQEEGARSAGPQFGSTLAAAVKHTPQPEAATVLEALWARDRLPLTMRKQILRSLVSFSGPEVGLPSRDETFACVTVIALFWSGPSWSNMP